MQKLARFVGYDNEEVLVKALKNGDALAVEFWFKHYKNKLKVIATHKIASQATANEIVQETFINCLQTINLFQGKSSLLTWMQSILRHEIADYYRKRYAKKFIQTIPLSEFLIDHNYKDAAGTAELVSAVLKKMVVKNRELLLKKYVDCQKVKDIALELGSTVKAVESDLFRARREFKALWLQVENKS
jgi:RNA polymerase sigma-70 factor (ECF subfamily)